MPIKICKKVFVLSFLFGILSIFPSIIYAETHVTAGYLYEGDHWTKEGSPYILEDYVNVPSWQKLTIDPGVIITTTIPVGEEEPYSLSVQGDLDVLGTASEPVHIEGLQTIFLSNGTTTIQNTILEQTGIDASKAVISIASSTISGASTALIARRSAIDIWNSEFSGNTKGIVSNLWLQGPVLSIVDGNAIGGPGNAEEQDHSQNIITIHDSILENNIDSSIVNKTSNVIDAVDNWWGDAAGPHSGQISGTVIIEPWKTTDPRVKVAKCCSNVLFLPGFEASRLYSRGITGSTSNTLWEPNRNGDVRKLFMNPDGSSLDPMISTKDVIGSAFGIKNIYKSLIAMMDGVVADKTINAWLPFAYDWRMSVPDVVSGSVLYSTTTKLLMTEVEKLAQSSKTGKVTIVAHSNGGLVAKALGKELERQGKIALIDKVIFAGVPQLGTPQAVAGMLHGDDESFIGNFPDKSVMRTLGLNTPGAYGLLPSQGYFSHIVAPIISFASSTITSYNDFIDFLTGRINKRKAPAESDLETPAILSQNLITKAQTLHSSIDSWNFPAATQTVFISGWGRDTTEAIKYLDDSFSLAKTLRGDGTVISGSSRGDALSTVFFNEGQFQHDTWEKIKHPNLLEGGPIRELISDLITKDNTAALGNIALPKYMTREEPDPNNFPYLGSLVVSVHSPVDIEVYDNHGGHIGLVPLKDIAPGHEDSDLMWVDDTIGGNYEEYGDDKYITLPTYTADTYTVRLKGTGTGTFTFNIQKFDSNRHEIASTTYADLPVTPLLVASTSLTSLSLTPVLNIDVDGNGKTDIQAKPATTSDSLIHLEAMRQVILSLNLKPLVEKALLLKIDALKLLVKKGKADKFISRIKKLSQKTGKEHWYPKKLNDSQRTIIHDMFVKFLDSM